MVWGFGVGGGVGSFGRQGRRQGSGGDMRVEVTVEQSAHMTKVHDSQISDDSSEEGSGRNVVWVGKERVSHKLHNAMPASASWFQAAADCHGPPHPSQINRLPGEWSNLAIGALKAAMKPESLRNVRSLDLPMCRACYRPGTAIACGGCG